MGRIPSTLALFVSLAVSTVSAQEQSTRNHAEVAHVLHVLRATQRMDGGLERRRKRGCAITGFRRDNARIFYAALACVRSASARVFASRKRHHTPPAATARSAAAQAAAPASHATPRGKDSVAEAIARAQARADQFLATGGAGSAAAAPTKPAE